MEEIFDNLLFLYWLLVFLDNKLELEVVSRPQLLYGSILNKKLITIMAHEQQTCIALFFLKCTGNTKLVRVHTPSTLVSTSMNESLMIVLAQVKD